MIHSLTTNAERLAEQAESLPAFSGIKLLHIKRSVGEILGHIGHNGSFDEYTRHDISHIDAMLEMLDWLIPEATKTIMQPADWLTIVLAIYFHDMGMLVTKTEFAHRLESGFVSFRDEILFAGDQGTDYLSKVNQLPEVQRERFLYQEFVRSKHGQRVRHWIMGESQPSLGISDTIAGEVDRLLAALKPNYRRDLGFICESHDLDELDNFDKFDLSRPYGNTSAETVNMHFAAIVLRTADLLHITRDRTPPVLFRLINPSDPVSQQEWAKQMAVTCVRSKIATDQDGQPAPEAPRDTIEVHAFFAKPDGFFGLTSYLSYATKQLRRNCDVLQAGMKRSGVPYLLPWRAIDDSHIEADGFLKQSYEFTLDNARILDLLTGHTLYNETDVVLRELVQNALDAVRLQHMADRRTDPDARVGTVKILWDSSERMLTVQDNGTGMTQQIVERHLLKVGASRYQDQDFKKEFPTFSSISRFGIGILSVFMIADEVEVLTCHPNDEKARLLTLRSVHGKYLVRLLDKESDPDAKALHPHGTQVRIRVRASSKQMDVLATARRWVAVPGCAVTLQIDSQTPISVGYSSPKAALTAFLTGVGRVVGEGGTDVADKAVRVIERSSPDGITLAYAVQWSQYFREWSFLTVAQVARPIDRVQLSAGPGTCIEGIRVEAVTPGFRDHSILAIANATGTDAPKTNVARSGLESTAELERMCDAVYRMLCDHVSDEMERLKNDRSFSLTWSVQEGKYLLTPILAGERCINVNSLLAAVGRLPLILVERDGSRTPVSPETLRSLDHFWTIESAFFTSAESLLREAGSSSSISRLVKALDVDGLSLPGGTFLCTMPKDAIGQYSFADYEVDAIRIDQTQRRVEFRWTRDGPSGRWAYLTAEQLQRLLSEEANSGIDPRHFLRQPLASKELALALRQGLVFARERVEVTGSSGEFAVKCGGLDFVLPGSKLCGYMVDWIDRCAAEDGHKALSLVMWMTNVIGYFRERNEGGHEPPTRTALERDLHGARVDPLPEGFDLHEFYRTLSETNFSVFNPYAWRRQAGSQ